MSNYRETPPIENLITEQERVQAEKFQSRLLEEHNGYIFPGQTWRVPRGSAVADLGRPLMDGAEVSLQAMLRGLSASAAGRQVHWVDMGGGRALPMRQLATIMPALRMTNVDLFNFGLGGVRPEEIDYLEALSPGMTRPEAAPFFIWDNIETVMLPEPADLITAVEVLQYLNDPLQALANWYNQLTDDRIMIIVGGRDWAHWIRYRRDADGRGQHAAPAYHVLEELASNGVPFAATYADDDADGYRPLLDPGSFRILAVQKKAGTLLRVNQQVVNVWVSPHKFKAVYYEDPAAGSSPIVEVV